MIIAFIVMFLMLSLNFVCICAIANECKETTSFLNKSFLNLFKELTALKSDLQVLRNSAYKYDDLMTDILNHIKDVTNDDQKIILQNSKIIFEMNLAIENIEKRLNDLDAGSKFFEKINEGSEKPKRKTKKAVEEEVKKEEVSQDGSFV